MFSITRLAAIAALIVLATGALAQAPATDVSLAPKWQKDAEARYIYKASSTRINRLPAMKAEQEQKTRQEFVIRRKVISTGPEGTELELIFERLIVVSMSGKMFIRVDTNDPPDPDRVNALDPVVRPAANRPIRVRLGPDHRVLAVENIPKGADADGNPTALVVDEELVRNSLAAMYSLERNLPSARNGDRWTVTESLPAGAGAELNIIHTRQLSGTDGSTAQVESSAIADVVPKGTSPDRPPLLVEFTCKASFDWDLAAGGLRWMTLDQKIETHGVVRQMRSEHVSQVTISIALAGVEIPERKFP